MEKNLEQQEEPNKFINENDNEILSKVKEWGLEFNSVDELKEQLSRKAPERIQTPDEIKQLEKEFEKRLVNEFLEDGGTAETYSELKKISQSDSEKIGRVAAIKEYIDEGYTEEQAESLLKRRYFEYTQEELEELDEDLKQEAIKEKSLGLKKLKAKGDNIVNYAKNNLEILKTKINHKDNALKLEQTFATEVEGHLANYNKAKEFDLGEYNGNLLPKIKFDVDDDTINEVKTQLTNKKQLEELIFNEKDEIKIDFVTEALINKKLVSKMIKEGYLQGQNNAISNFKQVYPEKNHVVGLFGNSKKTEGSFTYSGVGKTVVV